MTHKKGHDQKPRSHGQQGIGRTQKRNQQEVQKSTQAKSQTDFTKSKQRAKFGTTSKR